MSKLHERLIEDRELRDAARTVLLDDLHHARVSFSAKGVADRIGGRIGDGAKDVFENAKERTGDKGGLIAALLGAVMLWFAREPLFELLGLTDVEPGSEADEAVGEEASDEIASDTIEETPPGDDDEH